MSTKNKIYTKPTIKSKCYGEANKLRVVYFIYTNNSKWYCISKTKDAWVNHSNNIIYYKEKYSVPDYIISDYDFTNQNYKYSDMINFYNQFSTCYLTENNIKLIYENCRDYNINFLIIASKLQQENSLICNNDYTSNSYNIALDRSMGYDLQDKKSNGKSIIYKYSGYENQISNGIRVLRKWFDRYDDTKYITINPIEKVIKPKNAATYSIYQYSHTWGYCYDGAGVICIGNYNFYISYNKFKKIYERLK